MLCKLIGAGHCTSAKRMTSILRHVAEAFPPARQGTIQNNHRVIGIAAYSSMVLNCALVTYIMTHKPLTVQHHPLLSGFFIILQRCTHLIVLTLRRHESWVYTDSVGPWLTPADSRINQTILVNFLIVKYLLIELLELFAQSVTVQTTALN